MAKDKRRQLLEDGFCIVEDVLPAALLNRLREVTERLAIGQTAEQAQRQRTTGSMISVMSDPVFAELVALPEALAAFRDLGYPTPSFSDGWIISKPGRSPRLFWHYDWFTWQDPASYRTEPPQVSLMYYLSDTRRENGCLRVIPGSHIRHNPLHDLLTVPRRELTGAVHADRAEFDDRPDEIDVPVRAGDLLIADARLLHAAQENRTDSRRTLITLWYQPDLAALPERVQAQMAAKTQRPEAGWLAAAVELLARLQTRYEGTAQPYERTLRSSSAAAHGAAELTTN